MFEKNRDFEKNQPKNNQFFIHRKPQQKDPLKDLYEIFLAYFDEKLGHIALFTFPTYLKKDKMECRIITIHSIWWLDTETQQDLEHVDLEYSGRNYIATKFKAKSHREKTRCGLTTETPETFVLITSVPISLTPFGTNMLNNLFHKIQDLKDELYILIEKELANEKPIKTQKDKESIVKGTEIEAKLLKICEESIPHITPDVLNTLVNVEDLDQENLAFLLLDDLHLLEPGIREFDASQSKAQIKKSVTQEGEVFKRKIEITKISLMETEKKLKITVKNIANRDLNNITIWISHIQEFFEAASWNTTIDVWYANEELIFQYPRIIDNDNDEYMLRIEDQSGKLLVKKISYLDFYNKEA
ncbi:MAG: hypothetical protein ACFFD2_02125 [Promethearchaeota archaeon]